MAADPNPYESPKASPIETVQVYRSSLPFTTFMLVLLSNTVFLVVRFLVTDASSDPRSLVVSMSQLTFVIIVLSLAAVIAFPLYVSQNGIRSYNAWGRYHTIEWSEMLAVKPMNLLGLRYLRVKAADSSQVIWIPLYLANQDKFFADIQRYSDSDNPLRRYTPPAA